MELHVRYNKGYAYMLYTIDVLNISHSNSALKWPIRKTFFSNFASLQLNIEQSVLQCCVIRNFIACMRGVVLIAVTVCEPCRTVKNQGVIS